MRSITRLLPAIMLVPTLTLAAADPALSQADVTFIQKATIYNLAEVKAAQLALERDLTIDERMYAQELVRQHTQANEDLAALARRKHVSVSDTIPGEVLEELTDLGVSQGNEFNERFLEDRIAVHQQALHYLGHASDSRDPDLRMYAQAGLIAVRHHLDTAKRLEARY